MKLTRLGKSLDQLRGALIAALVVSCAGAHHDQDEPLPTLARTQLGEIVTIVGSGKHQTDPVDKDRDGNVDQPVGLLVANLDEPMDVGFSPSGQMYVVDSNGNKIRAVVKDALAFVSGSGFEGDTCEVSHDGRACPAAAQELNNPTSIAFDQAGSLFICAWQNSKIKRQDLDAGTVQDWCGDGMRMFKGDGQTCQDSNGGGDVSFDLPSSIAVDTAGNLFISDQSNQVVRRIGSDDDVVKTVVGNCPGTPGFGCPAGKGYSGDGGDALGARLGNYISQSAEPQGRIAFDSQGNLYIADTDNNVVRRVAPGSDGILGDGDPAEEIITTYAGNGTAGYDGDGGPAVEGQLSHPTDVAVARDGTLYIADRANACIRRVSPDGTLFTVAGTCGSAGFSGDGQRATDARLSDPYGVAVDEEGNLFIADTGNNRIREVVMAR